MAAEVISTGELFKRVGAWEDAEAAQRFMKHLGSGFRATGNGFTSWAADFGMWYWEADGGAPEPARECVGEVLRRARDAGPGEHQHVWFPSGLSVYHSHRGYGHGPDSVGVGLGEDRLGPFPSQRMARQVANAFNTAYQLGRDRG